MTVAITEFENEFLSEIAFSLKKRRKSLKHSFQKIICDKVSEVKGDKKTEKLELTLQSALSSKSTQLRLYAWPDRWVWVDARKAAKKGWEWEWTYEGRLLGEFTGRDLIASIEKAMFDAIDAESLPVSSEVSAIWQPLLAKGPVRVT